MKYRYKFKEGNDIFRFSARQDNWIFFEYENPKLEYWSITLERLNNDVYAGYIVPIDEYGNQLYLLKDF